MATLIGPLVTAVAFALYFIVTFQLAIYRRRPWEYVAAMAIGVGLSVQRAVAQPAIPEIAALAMSLAVFAFALWFLFVYARPRPREDRPRVGDRFPSFRLPTSDGGVFDLDAARGKRLVILFYRGSW